LTVSGGGGASDQQRATSDRIGAGDTEESNGTSQHREGGVDMGVKKAAAKTATKAATKEVKESVDQAVDKAIDKGPLDRAEDVIDEATEDLGRKAVKKAVS
jgi:hypothetical protein